MIHHLKSYPEFFAATVIGVKRHEIRSTIDNLSVDGTNAPFAVGDTLCLHEYDPVSQSFTEDYCEVRVTWMDGPKPWMDPDFVAMSIELEAC